MYIPLDGERVRIKQTISYQDFDFSLNKTFYTPTNVPYTVNNPNKGMTFYVKSEGSKRSYMTSWTNVEPWDIDESIKFREDKIKSTQDELNKQIKKLKEMKEAKENKTE